MNSAQNAETIANQRIEEYSKLERLVHETHCSLVGVIEDINKNIIPATSRVEWTAETVHQRINRMSQCRDRNGLMVDREGRPLQVNKSGLNKYNNFKPKAGATRQTKGSKAPGQHQRKSTGGMRPPEGNCKSGDLRGSSESY